MHGASIHADRWICDHFPKAKELLKQETYQKRIFNLASDCIHDRMQHRPCMRDLRDGLLKTRQRKFLMDLKKGIIRGKKSNLQQVTNFCLDWFQSNSDQLPSGNLFDSIKDDTSTTIFHTYKPLKANLILYDFELKYNKKDTDRNFDYCLFFRMQRKKNCIVIKTFEPPNPTSYIFNQPYQIIKDSLAFCFTFTAQHKDENLNGIFFKMVNMGTDTLQKMETTFNLETSKNAIFGSGYFLEPNTENDFFLHTMRETWNSPVYYFGCEPKQCVETFALKFDSIDRVKTRISVQTLTSIIFKRRRELLYMVNPRMN